MATKKKPAPKGGTPRRYSPGIKSLGKNKSGPVLSIKMTEDGKFIDVALMMRCVPDGQGGWICG